MNETLNEVTQAIEPSMIARLLHDTNFWVMISTVLCFAFIAVKARGGVAAAFAKRTETIRNRLAEAESLRNEAHQLLLQARERSEKAMEEAEFIVQNAQRRAEQMQAQMEADLKKMVAREETKAQNRIKRMEDEVVRAIKDDIINLAMNDIRHNAANDLKVKPSIDGSMDTIKSILQQ